MSTLVHFIVEGSPTGKGRPNFSTKTATAYTPAKTRLGEARVREAWRAAGKPRIDGDDTPLEMTLFAYLARPKSHFRKGGELSAAGLRCEYPVRKPDDDNILKLVADALNGCAYRDDVQIVDGHICKRWCAPGEFERVRVTVRRMPHVWAAVAA